MGLKIYMLKILIKDRKNQHNINKKYKVYKKKKIFNFK